MLPRRKSAAFLLLFIIYYYINYKLLFSGLNLLLPNFVLPVTRYKKLLCVLQNKHRSVSYGSPDYFLICDGWDYLYSLEGAFDVSCLNGHNCFHQTRPLHFYSIVELN